VVFWFKAPSRLIGVYKRFGGKYWLHLHFYSRAGGSALVRTNQTRHRHNPEDRDMTYVPRLLTSPTVLANCCVNNTRARHGTVPQQYLILSVCPSRSVSQKRMTIADERKLKSCPVSEGKLGYIVNYNVTCTCMGSIPSQIPSLLKFMFSGI
jgi:hypothetical protein